MNEVITCADCGKIITEKGQVLCSACLEKREKEEDEYLKWYDSFYWL